MIEVLKQALEAFEIAAEGGGVNFHAYAEELRKAIAELESQEPVAWIAPRYEGGHENLEVVDEREFGAFRVYTHPPQRTWQGLTDEEAQWLYDNCRTPGTLIDMVEAKLREKNSPHKEKNS